MYWALYGGCVQVTQPGLEVMRRTQQNRDNQIKNRTNKQKQFSYRGVFIALVGKAHQYGHCNTVLSRRDLGELKGMRGADDCLFRSPQTVALTVSNLSPSLVLSLLIFWMHT